MKRNLGLWLVSLVVVALSVAPCVHAADVTVDCDGGPADFATLQDAVNAVFPGGSTITVTGTCEEDVVVSRYSDLTIQGPATIMSVTEDNGAVLIIDSTQNFQLRNLTIDGAGQFVDGIDIGNSTGNIRGATIQNTTGCGVAAFSGSEVVVGGRNAGQQVLLTNHVDCGVFEGQSILTLFGQVTIQNIHGGVGAWAQGGRLGINGGTVGNLIQDVDSNGFGVFAQQAAVVVFNGLNTIQNAGDLGIAANQNSTVNVNSTLAGGVTPVFTTISGSDVAGLLASDSIVTFQGNPAAPHQIMNNGTAPVTIDAGLLAYRNATVRVYQTSVTNNVGPGVAADANSTVEVADAHITGNSGDGVNLAHSSVARFGAFSSTGDAVPANSVISGNTGSAVACDDTSVAFGDLAGITPIACKVTTTDKKKPGTVAASTLSTFDAKAEQRLTRWLERHPQQ